MNVREVYEMGYRDAERGRGRNPDRAVAAQLDNSPQFIDVVFDGPPSHESGRFVEVEDPQGHGIKVGEWIDRGNGLWALRIPRLNLFPIDNGPGKDHCAICKGTKNGTIGNENVLTLSVCDYCHAELLDRRPKAT